MYATVLALKDVILINNKGGLPTALQRMKFHYLPWLGGTVAYTATVSTVCGLRGGKTDQWNHAVGGSVVGAIIGKLSRNFLGGLASGFLLSVLAYHYKDSRINGYEIFPTKVLPGIIGHPFSHKCDWSSSWSPPRKGYWARTPEEAAEVYKLGQYGDGVIRRVW